MKKIRLYEKAMCCPTGLCGPVLDPELIRISVAIDNMTKNKVDIDRYNLSSFPDKFAKNEKIKEQLKEKGKYALPITTVDDEIIMTGRYLTNEEFAEISGISVDLISKKDEEDACKCEDGETCDCENEESKNNSDSKSSCC
ncbi:arsenite efflux transporter metallochaperone ArsD [Anaerococcus sp. Marseille-P3625]|uniref:arsenite efflux transporter metallochaperone ArsD n=1 Tax=Anaerococcus sp. Marseille-P3625 TaxID=1977277 RepID=UPI000C07ACB4|nr:arsenite efflux transporter metallochaperone ArsD [Anaerococcus sp. Marseille-P3625]